MSKFTTSNQIQTPHFLGSSAKELYLKDESWSLPGHILLCFLFLHCSGSHSVGPELVASASASAGNFFESEGVRSSHPCLNKSYRRVSCTPKFQNHCPNGTTFLFDSGSDYRCFHLFIISFLSLIPHSSHIKWFPKFCHSTSLTLVESIPFLAIPTLIQGQVNFRLLQ